jgi:hypothetical protein
MRWCLFLLLLSSCFQEPEYLYKQDLEITYCRRNEKDKVNVISNKLITSDLIYVARYTQGKRVYEYEVVTTLEFYDYTIRNYKKYLDICNVEPISVQRVKNHWK